MLYEMAMIHLFYQGNKNVHILPSSCAAGLARLMSDELCVKSLDAITHIAAIEKEGALRRLIGSDRSIHRLIDREVLNRLVSVGFANHFNAFKSVVEQYFVDVAKRRPSHQSLVGQEDEEGDDRVGDVAKPMSYKLFALRCFSTNPVRHLDELPYRLLLRLACERHGISNDEVGQMIETLFASIQFEDRQVYDIEESGNRRRYKQIRLVVSGGIAEDQTSRLEVLRSEFERLITRSHSRPKRTNWSTAERIRLSNAHCRFGNISNCYVKIASLFTFGFALCRSPEVIRSTWKYMLKTLSMEDHENIALGWNPASFDMEDRVRQFARFGIEVNTSAQIVLQEILNLEAVEIPALVINHPVDTQDADLQVTQNVPTNYDICESEGRSFDFDGTIGDCDVTFHEIHQVYDALGYMNLQMKRLVGAVKSIKSTRNEHQADYVKREGVREDWIVKKRRILSRRHTEWIESDFASRKSDEQQVILDKVLDEDDKFIDNGRDVIHLESDNTEYLRSENSVPHDEEINHLAELTPPSTVQKGGKITVDVTEPELIVGGVQGLFDDIFGDREVDQTILDTVPRHSNASTLVFNEESRIQVMRRMRGKYGNGEFYSGIARNILFRFDKRPSTEQWAVFINGCVSNNILKGELYRGRYRYKFI